MSISREIWRARGGCVDFPDGGVSLNTFIDAELKAQLIAAAPKMLALLKDIAKADDAAIAELAKLGMQFDGPAYEMTKRIWLMIAEAEGQS